MNAMNTSLLAQELEPLNAQIELLQDRIETLEGELRIAEAGLDAFSADRKRFDALQNVCNALDSLSDLEAGELFWNELPGINEPEGFVGLLRGQVEKFEKKIQAGLQQQASIKQQVEFSYDELDHLNDQVMDAHAREERRRDEFVIEREISSSPYRRIIMPWNKDGETERYFRRTLLVAFLLCIVFGSIIPLVSIPVPDRSATVVEIPERLAMLVKKEPPKPEPIPVPKPQKEEEKIDPEKKKPDQKKTEKVKPKPVEKPTKVAASKGEKKAARKKAESTGVLAFKDTFKDLIDETPVAKLGTEARINNNASLAAGHARPQRSLVAMQATSGSSGGIRNSTVSRNLGAGGTGGNGDRIGGVAFARVESAVADLQEENRPLSDGPGPARTDEEIQIVFDRYKATLYRIYNKELRKDPTLRGKLLLRITIEPGGGVSLCEAESTDLASPELVDKILARVKRFNFGEKENVPKITILYPIDFLPAG